MLGTMARTCSHSSKSVQRFTIVQLHVCVKQAIELTEDEIDRKILICAHHIEDIAGNLAVGVCQSVERIIQSILLDL